MRKFEVSLSLFASPESIFTTVEVQAEVFRSRETMPLHFFEASPFLADESMAEIATLQALVIEVKGIEEVAAER